MSEIYIEGRFKMPVVNTDEFGYDEEEVKKFDWEDFAKDEFWNSCDYMGELEDKYDITFHKVQPQLTIPQSIADALDVGDLIFLAWTHGNDLLGKMSDEERNAECRRRNAIAKAYLAGKALGVDLVKVVEG
ncbi:hypothetical protein [Lactococcus lactis]|uniref:hypothetical protein n=1 Tax=Lactococcus lactis TaxID=1358 RepID=UPI00273939DA|nr:hypothetical protein [Lactococcus lactis]